MADKTPTITTKGPDTSAWKTAGRNVRHHVLDNVLFIAVDISKGAFDAVTNVTAKGNKVIASTLGNVPVTDTLKMGINIYGPPATA